ncbi:MAG TPA: hypothetical protein VIV11_18965 [Kofleriaceae bacterium]
MRSLALCLLAAGCGVTSGEPFLLETTDCAVVNNFMTNGIATAWNDCRVYWSGSSRNILTVAITTPGSTGSFTAPAQTWIVASVHVPAGNLQGDLMTTPHSTGALPDVVAEDRIALSLSIGSCSNLGAIPQTVSTMADVGNASASFSFSLSGTCDGGQGPTTYSGGFIISASAQDGAMTNGDPDAVVTTP